MQGLHFDGVGRLGIDVLQSNLMLDDYDIFVCGPPAFMQAIYDDLRRLGVRDDHIFAEAFGPASLTRDVALTSVPLSEEADIATLTFAASGFEQRWSAGDPTVLETAEAHGLTPDFSCRSGSCGSCATRLLKGKVSYRTPITAEHAEDEVLICCAVPAKNCDTLILDL